jgi:3-methyladenine DNA glycosylase AlkD
VTPGLAATHYRAKLAALARPAGAFDASRYFRGTKRLGFYNVGTSTVRQLARECVAAHADNWTIGDVMAFAEPLMRDRYLEVKGLALESAARYRREFTPALLPVWKRWLAADYASNWATTDTMCGLLLGPLLVKFPRLIPQLLPWSRHKNLWVRRASIVALLPAVRRGLALDQVYATAAALHPDPNDLIHKAVGWALREAGKIDGPRLERYLREHGATIPRTTIRYAIERFAPARRKALLAVTKAGKAGGKRGRRADV